MSVSNTSIKNYIDKVYSRMFLTNKNTTNVYAEAYTFAVGGVNSENFSWKTYIALLFYPTFLTGKNVSQFVDEIEASDGNKNNYAVRHYYEAGAFIASKFIEFMNSMGVEEVPADVLSFVSNYHVFENIADAGENSVGTTQDFNALVSNFVTAKVITNIIADNKNLPDNVRQGVADYYNFLKNIISVYIEVGHNRVYGIEDMRNFVEGDFEKTKKFIGDKAFKVINNFVNKTISANSNQPNVVLVAGVPDTNYIEQVAREEHGSNFIIVSSTQSMYDVAKRHGFKLTDDRPLTMSDLYNFINTFKSRENEREGKLWNEVQEDMSEKIARALKEKKVVYISRMFRSTRRVKKFFDALSNTASINTAELNIKVLYVSPVSASKMNNLILTVKDGDKEVPIKDDTGERNFTLQYPYVPFSFVDSSLLSGIRQVIPFIATGRMQDFDSISLPTTWNAVFVDLERNRTVEKGRAKIMTEEEFQEELSTIVETVRKRAVNNELQELIDSGGIDATLD